MRIETDDGQPFLENVIPPQSMWTGRCSVCHVEIIGDTSLDIRWQFKTHRRRFHQDSPPKGLGTPPNTSESATSTP